MAKLLRQLGYGSKKTLHLAKSTDNETDEQNYCARKDPPPPIKHSQRALTTTASFKVYTEELSAQSTETKPEVKQDSRCRGRKEETDVDEQENLQNALEAALQVIDDLDENGESSNWPAATSSYGEATTTWERQQQQQEESPLRGKLKSQLDSSSSAVSDERNREKRLQEKNAQVFVLQDYSDPYDLQLGNNEGHTVANANDDDYTEPENVISISELPSEYHPDYENVSIAACGSPDCRPQEDYDQPWEWLPVKQFSWDEEENQDDVISDDLIFVNEAGCIMTGRQRHIYETAFDSTVKPVKLPAELEELANHPILRNDSPLITPTTTPKLPVKAVTSRDMPIPSNLTPKEKRKVTLIRDGFRHNYKKEGLHSLSSDRFKDNRAGCRTEQVKALIHAPPRSANSTPLISHRFRHIDSAASSARSTPTHYTSSSKVSVQVPVKPLSDLSLSAKSSKGFSDGYQTLPHLSSRSTASPQISRQSRSEMVKSISSEETLFSKAKLKPVADPSIETTCELYLPKTNLEKTETSDSDPRPVDDYDPPWEFAKKKRVLPFSFSLDSAQIIADNSSNELSNNSSSAVDVHSSNSTEVSGVQGKPQPRLSLSLPLKQCDSSTDSSAPSRTNLALNFGGQTQKRKISLQLNFGCAALSAVGEKVDPAIPLERQGWYHGSISRTDAENVLRVLKEGSYLIRNSESNKHDYSLSLKSARGFMHMKIVNLDGNYILGQFSKPFLSIPEMIHHYSINKLPIKGAEHMSLLYPVIDQLL